MSLLFEYLDELKKVAVISNHHLEIAKSKSLEDVFAAVKEEREACAKIADEVRLGLASWQDFGIAEDIAKFIRQRGQS